MFFYIQILVFLREKVKGFEILWKMKEELTKTVFPKLLSFADHKCQFPWIIKIFVANIEKNWSKMACFLIKLLTFFIKNILAERIEMLKMIRGPVFGKHWSRSCSFPLALLWSGTFREKTGKNFWNSVCHLKLENRILLSWEKQNRS
jgi:hypothetical protein